MISPRRAIADVRAENALLWAEFRTQYDLAGKRVTDNLGRAVGAPKTVQLGDGTTANTIPAQVKGKHGLVFTGTQYVDTGIVDPFEYNSRFTVFFILSLPKPSNYRTIISSESSSASSFWKIDLDPSNVVRMLIADGSGVGYLTLATCAVPCGVCTFAVTCDGSRLATGFKAYTNGALISQTNNFSACGTLTQKVGNTVRLGCGFTTVPAYLIQSGSVMNFAAIFPWDLTPQQVMYLDRLVKTRINQP